MELQKARDWLDLVLKSLLLFALILLGAWAGYRLWSDRVAVTRVQLVVWTEYKPFSDDARLLLIHVKPKNVGQANMQPGKEGVVVLVRSFAPNAAPGVQDLEKMRELHKIVLTDKFPDDYPLQPGVEYDEVMALVVPKGATFAIKATLDLGDETEVSHTSVAHGE